VCAEPLDNLLNKLFLGVYLRAVIIKCARAQKWLDPHYGALLFNKLLFNKLAERSVVTSARGARRSVEMHFTERRAE
jgi:hypothetical protein